MTRVYELIRELGSIVENDLNAVDCDAARWALRHLSQFANFTASAKELRQAGSVAEACEYEAMAQRRYQALPEAARW